MANTPLAVERDRVAALVGAETVAGTLPPPGAQARLFADSHVVLDQLWTEEFATALATEAITQRPFAGAPSEGPEVRVAPGRASSRPAVMVGPGPLLAELHHSLVGFLRGLSARMLVPSQATYTYYEFDEEVRLHIDTPACDVTVLTEVLGNLGPLHLHPELTGWQTPDLLDLEADPAWDRDSGLPVVHPRLGATIIRGRVLPHHRPAWPVEGLHAIAALHYRSLF
jgi:hypothetical protein